MKIPYVNEDLLRKLPRKNNGYRGGVVAVRTSRIYEKIQYQKRAALEIERTHSRCGIIWSILKRPSRNSTRYHGHLMNAAFSVSILNFRTMKAITVQPKAHFLRCHEYRGQQKS